MSEEISSSPPIAHYSQLTTHCYLLIALFLPLIARCYLLCSLPPTRCSLLPTHCSLPPLIASLPAQILLTPSHHTPTAPFRLLQRVADSRLVLLLCLATLPATALLYYPTTGAEHDVWFHLTYGRHYVENLTFQIDHSMFSWTPADPDWLYGTWLGSAALYLTWLIGGAPGLYILQWLTLLGMFALFCVYVHVIGERFNLTHVAFFLLIFVAIRPIAMFIKPFDLVRRCRLHYVSAALERFYP